MFLPLYCVPNYRRDIGSFIKVTENEIQNETFRVPRTIPCKSVGLQHCDRSTAQRQVEAQRRWTDCQIRYSSHLYSIVRLKCFFAKANLHCLADPSKRYRVRLKMSFPPPMDKLLDELSNNLGAQVFKLYSTRGDRVCMTAFQSSPLTKTLQLKSVESIFDAGDRVLCCRKHERPTAHSANGTLSHGTLPSMPSRSTGSSGNHLLDEFVSSQH